MSSTAGTGLRLASVCLSIWRLQSQLALPLRRNGCPQALRTTCPGRGAALLALLRRAGTHARTGPGSAAHRKCAALRLGHAKSPALAQAPPDIILCADMAGPTFRGLPRP